MLKKRIVVAALLVMVWSGWRAQVSAADAGPARCVAPTTPQELQVRVAALRRHYEPFLRSLPERLPPCQRTVLPKLWKFTFEAKATPEKEEIPPPPPWHVVGLDESNWETTTVPEWRYRVREGDTALEPTSIDKYLAKATTADTICWYRTTFPATRPAAGGRLWLCFDGVDWEAQVYLNGELLGNHRVYYEPFRFDVTEKLQATNTLAVRVIAGRSYGEPMTYWALFPDIRAAQQRYVPDRRGSIPGNLPIGYHAGGGFGIHRAVYLEQSGPVRVGDIFARNDLSDGNARVKAELDCAAARSLDLHVELLPENCEGRAYERTARYEVPQGQSVLSLEIAMPEARRWSPDEPCLYRCRVRVEDAYQTLDAKDALFGCRSFQIVHGDRAARDNLPEGMFLLNGKPLYLRGTNIHGLNAYWYWGQNDALLDTLMLLKAGNFNVVRSCQHVQFPEVREWLDRVGMMSEQDQGGGYRGSIDMGIRRPQHIHTGTVLARECYNNPGVVLLCFGNEHEFEAAPIVRAALEVDPQRIFKPISGRFSHSKKPWDLPEELRANAVDDGHPYSGWYGKVPPQTWSNLEILSPRRLVTLGEYGAEALDSYDTMRDHYPPQFQPPPATDDRLWAASQVEKHDVRQIVGLGSRPANLGQYIEASQNYQEALLADKTIGMRLSPQAVGGYFQFHFIDVVPVFWPKSIVSHDHHPKKAYFQMAQINQPVVPLAQLSGMRPDAMTLWVANDLAEDFPKSTLQWSVQSGGKTLLSGEETLDVPAVGAVAGNTIDLTPVTTKSPSFSVFLAVADAQGHLLSRYQRTVRVVPPELLNSR